MLFLNYDGGAWLDSFWYLFSGKFTWVFAYVVILMHIFLSCKSDKKRWIAFAINVVGIALIILLADQISSGIIKNLVERPRPSHSDIENMLHYVNDYKGGRFGFVSSHAANTIGLAFWLCLLFRSFFFHLTIITWSILTCYSRIYLGVHYLGDIIGGLCVGIFSAFFVYYLYRRFINKRYQILEEKKEPWPITVAILTTVLVIIGLSF